MFTVYIDDSGTAPDQPFAVASGLIFPALRIKSLEEEWRSFESKYGFSGFHTSECVAHNKHSQFAEWDEATTKIVLARARQIIRKYAVKGFGITIDKALYDRVVPDELRGIIGQYHYTWAVDNLCGFIRDWAATRNVPMKYVFDNTGKDQKREIDIVMENGEALHPGLFSGHYMFRNRSDLPTLQCADLFAWTCYQQSLWRINAKVLPPLANECWEQFINWNNKEWCSAWFIEETGLREWVRKVYNDNPAELARIRNLPRKFQGRTK